MSLEGTLQAVANLNNQATIQIHQQYFADAISTLTSAIMTLKQEALNCNGRPNTSAATPSSSSSSSSSSLAMANATIADTSSSMLKFLSSPTPKKQDVKRTFSNNNDSSTTITTTTVHGGSGSTSSSFTYPALPTAATATASSSRYQRQPMIAIDDDWYVYQDPVQVVATYRELSSSPVGVEVLSYAIIYNLGLCHHLAAVLDDCGTTSSTSTSTMTTTTTTSTKRTIQLQKALSFYNHAQTLLIANSTLSLQVDIIHSLVTTNNMGHAYHFLNHPQKAQICFEQLLHAILYLMTESSGPRGQQVLWQLNHNTINTNSNTMEHPQHEQDATEKDDEPCCLDCFLTNIMHLVLLGGTRAAPAA